MRRLLRTIGQQHSRLLWRWYPTDGLVIAIEWKLADLWVGAYVYTHAKTGTAYEEVNVYLILMPTLVLHIAWLERLS